MGRGDGEIGRGYFADLVMLGYRCEFGLMPAVDSKRKLDVENQMAALQRLLSAGSSASMLALGRTSDIAPAPTILQRLMSLAPHTPVEAARIPQVGARREEMDL